MRFSSVGLLISMFCFIFAIYFAGLLFFHVADSSLKAEFLALASAFFVAGIAVLTSCILLIAAKKLF